MWIDEQDDDLIRHIYEESRHPVKDSLSPTPQPEKQKIEISDMQKVFSLLPDPLAWDAFRMLGNSGGSGLGRYREELISTSISALVRCKM